MTFRSPARVKCVGLFLASFVLCGCGRTYEDNIKPPQTEKEAFSLATSGGAAKKLMPIKGTKDAILTGKVVFSGTVPAKRIVVGDNPECLKAQQSEKNKDDIYNQDWHVGEGEGVKNVLIFLKAPDGSFFQVLEEDKQPAEDTVVIDQPFCAFHPQVLVHYSAYMNEDGKLTPTGQRPVIKNSSVILHNANLQGADPKYKNSGFNENIPPGSQKADFSLNPQPKPLNLSCSVHPWMKADIWVFGHPYAVKTNEKGEFSIKNLPTGVDVQLVAWHPAVGFFGEGEASGKKMNFKAGTNNLNLTISPR